MRGFERRGMWIQCLQDVTGTEGSSSLSSSRAAQEAMGLEHKAQVQPESASEHLLEQGQANMEMKDF